MVLKLTWKWLKAYRNLKLKKKNFYLDKILIFFFKKKSDKYWKKKKLEKCLNSLRKQVKKENKP